LESSIEAEKAIRKRVGLSESSITVKNGQNMDERLEKKGQKTDHKEIARPISDVRCGCIKNWTEGQNHS
jgi:hypothetical protein